MLHEMYVEHAAKFDWIIFGGESGPRARACSLDWIREGVKFCRERNIACFVKQLGAKVTFERWEWKLQDDMKLKDKKGGDPLEWPEDLRVREFPTHYPSPHPAPSE